MRQLWQDCPWRRSWQCSWPYHSLHLFLYVLWHLCWADGKGQVVIIKLQLDLSKEYGIVLEGGGAKGAYQIGAWRALREAGIRIKGAAGTSVGALNGALICMDDFEKAEVAATYNLILNAANMIRNGVGIALGFLLGNLSDDLRFIPLSPALETGSVLVWKKDQAFSPTAAAFLRDLRRAE